MKPAARRVRARWRAVLAGAALWGALLAAPPAARADPPANPPAAPVSKENEDLELIPPPAQAAPAAAGKAPAQGGGAQRLYAENAFTADSMRADLLVPAPPPPPFKWQERLFLDAREQWSAGGAVRFYLSDRLNLRAENDLSFPTRENLINDLRELYVSTEVAARTYLDAGRINIKNGVALGYNPTDYFRTRAVVEPLSADPTVLREDRLGTVMVRAERIWEAASLTAAFAPRLKDPSPIYGNLDLPSFDPALDRTNAANRALVKSSLNIAPDFSPEILLYREGALTQLGANLTATLGQRVVAYLEWSGGRQAPLIARALAFGRETGTLPVNAPDPFAEPAGSSFQNQLAIGASCTLGRSVTLNLEYHGNTAGFSAADWNQWFALGAGRSARDPLVQELWYLREYALDQQQLASRHALFLRADWVDAFVPKLEITALADADPRDGSALVQLSAQYYPADKWTIGGQLIGYFGSRHSDFGSVPLAGSVLVSVARYF